MKSGWYRLVRTVAAAALAAGLWVQGAGRAEADDANGTAVTNGSLQTVAFNGNGGAPAGQTNVYVAGEAYGELPEASRTGYSFGGWWTARSGGSQVEASDIVGDETSRTLWARWTAEQYDVALDAQGGDGGSGAVSATYGVTMPAIDVPSQTGHTFGGYYSATNGGGTRYYTVAGKGSRTWNVASNATLYAKWTANAYKVTLDRQGGSGGEASVTARYGSELPATAAPKWTGYTFGGYYSEPNGDGTQYYTAAGKSARAWDQAAAKTLYAQWTAISYTVALDRQGGEGGTEESMATYGMALPGIEVPVRTGHTFGGYYGGPNGTGTQYYTAEGKSARGWDVAGNATLYAQWTPNAYKVTLDRQGGKGGAGSATATYGNGMPDIKPPTRTGYTFGGYYSGMDGEGTQYYTAAGKSAQVWDVAGNATLYAQWSVNSYAVALDRQGGKGGTASATATYGSEMPEITVPTRKGYTFGGYYRGMKGTGVQYYTAEGQSARVWNVASNATLYAKWTANSYEVTLDMQGGTGEVASATATYGKVMPAIKVPKRTGYAFGGYFSKKKGAGTQYYTAAGKSARTWNAATNATLYALWTANSYKVTLKRQGGKGGAASARATYGEAMPEIEVPTRTGYTFGGYYSATNGGGTCYYTDEGTSARKWNKAAATTLYAKWTVNSYTVTLDPQGGEGGTEETTATYGSALPEITVPTQTGCTFGGYYSATNGGGRKYYTPEGKGARAWNVASNATLYARWKVNTYVVTLDRQGGTGGAASAKATYGSALPAITVPTRQGYTFDGYYTAADGGGTRYYTAEGKGERTWDVATNTTLYANWTVNEEGTEGTAGAKKSAGREAEVETTTSDGADGSAVVDGDESTGWAPEGAYAGAWVVLTFEEARDVAEVEVVGVNLPEGMRVLLSEDADDWFEDEGGLAQYVWVVFPEGSEGLEVREIRVVEARE